MAYPYLFYHLRAHGQGDEHPAYAYALLEYGPFTFYHNRHYIVNYRTRDNNNNNDRLTAFDPGQPG